MAQLILPSLGEGITSGIVVSILVKEGDQIELEQAVVEVETDKVTMEVPSSLAGIVTKLLIKEGDELAVGGAILDIELDSSQLQKENDTLSKEEEVSEQSVDEASTTAIEIQDQDEDDVSHAVQFKSNSKDSNRNTRVSPRVRKFARELNVEVEEISSQSDLIVREDVLKYVRGAKPEQQNGSSTSSLPDFSKWGHVRSEPMTSVMKVTAKTMSQSWKEIPHAWLQGDADVTALEVERKNLNAETDLKLSLTVFLIKAVSTCLKQLPKFNCSLDKERDQLILKEYVNIGVAVDTAYGLFVPVIKDVDRMPLSQISESLGQLATKAKDKKLKLDELEGGNFTVSNLGGFGTSAIFPVILPPQVAILGVASYQIRDGKKYLPLTIGFDHRVIDGADAGRFLQRLVSYLENPVKLLV